MYPPAAPQARIVHSRARARARVFMLHLPRFAQMTTPMPPSGFQVGHCKSTQRYKTRLTLLHLPGGCCTRT